LTTQVVAGLHVNLDWHTTRFELAIGARLSLEFGAWYEVKIGPHDAKEIPDKNETTFKKVETSLESLRSALTFNASALNFQSTGVKLKMVMGKIDLGL
jgi:aromatic ring-cleaving dioxygenase